MKKPNINAIQVTQLVSEHNPPIYYRTDTNGRGLWRNLVQIEHRSNFTLAGLSADDANRAIERKIGICPVNLRRNGSGWTWQIITS